MAAAAAPASACCWWWRRTWLGADVILISMVCGFVLRNASGDKCESLFALMRQFSLPVMVRLLRAGGRAAGGHGGAAVADRRGGALRGGPQRRARCCGAYAGRARQPQPAAVRSYTGPGRSSPRAPWRSASRSWPCTGWATCRRRTACSSGQVIIFTITTTTLIVEVIGPPLVKLAAELAGEIGRNVTEEDVIDSWKVADVTDREAGDRAARATSCAPSSSSSARTTTWPCPSSASRGS